MLGSSGGGKDAGSRRFTGSGLPLIDLRGSAGDVFEQAVDLLSAGAAVSHTSSLTESLTEAAAVEI